MGISVDLVPVNASRHVAGFVHAAMRVSVGDGTGEAVESTGRPSCTLGVMFLICEHLTILLTIMSSYRTFFSENFRWCTEFVNMQTELLKFYQMVLLFSH